MLEFFANILRIIRRIAKLRDFRVGGVPDKEHWIAQDRTIYRLAEYGEDRKMTINAKTKLRGSAE